MSYRNYLPQRLDPQGVPVFPLAFPDRPRPAQGIAARSDETRSGSAEGKSPVPARHAPKSLFSRLFRRHPHAR